MKRPYTEPSGWAFEFENDWYPDIDDTAMVMLAFPHMQRSERARAGGHAQARHRLAARHAVERRRLGGVRRR